MKLLKKIPRLTSLVAVSAVLFVVSLITKNTGNNSETVANSHLKNPDGVQAFFGVEDVYADAPIGPDGSPNPGPGDGGDGCDGGDGGGDC